MSVAYQENANLRVSCAMAAVVVGEEVACFADQSRDLVRLGVGGR